MHSLLRATNPLCSTVEENAEFRGDADNVASQVHCTHLKDSDEADEVLSHAQA